MFYVDSPLIEHKMGVIKPDGDLTHRVMTGQTFAARVHNEDFRAMLQIDHIDKEEDAPPGPEFKITFINIVSLGRGLSFHLLLLLSCHICSLMPDLHA
jgi:hypothetical protein